MLKMSKMPGYPYLRIQYPTPPTGVWPEQHCRELAAGLVEPIVERLTAQRQAVGSP